MSDLGMSTARNPGGAARIFHFSLEQQLLTRAALAVLPALAVCYGLLGTGEFSSKVVWTFGLFATAWGLGGILATRASAIRPLQSIANALEAMRQGDQNTRLRGADECGVSGRLAREANRLADKLCGAPAGAGHALSNNFRVQLGGSVCLLEAMVSLQQIRSKSKSSLHRRVVWMATIASLPAVLICFGLMWVGDFSGKVIWTFGLIAVGFAVGGIAATRMAVVRPLQTLANVLAAVREGDYSLRVRGAADDDSLGAVVREVNTLGETLRVQRLGAQEAEALLRKVMEEIPVGIFAFDAERKLALVNRAGAAMLARTPEQLRRSSASELGLEACLEGAAEQVIELDLPGAKGRFDLHRDTFREGGRPHEMLVLNDVSAPLREEERLAWQRLVRVLGHEINNSLAPIRSLTGSLKTIISRDPLPEDWNEDVVGGLEVIGSRAESLNRFMSAYASLARLPKPVRAEHAVGPLVERVAGLEQRMEVTVGAGPEVTANFDADQIEQVLVNLVKNGVEAAGEAGGGGVEVRWSDLGTAVEIDVLDEGPGLSGTKNLFVPFFTTKPKGSGIGLVLCRQIAEAHGGSLTLENRTDRVGCVAKLVLPK